MSAIDQSEVLSRTDSNASVLPASGVLSANEIGQKVNESSGAFEPFSGESSSTLVASQTICGISDDERELPEDDPTVPLLSSRRRDFVPAVNIIDNRTSEPPPSQQSSCIQCMCCFRVTNDMLENNQKLAYYTHYARQIRNSKFILFVLVALLSIPVSAIYFGVTYKESCPMAKFLPVLLMLMGVVGVFFIVVRLETISIRRGLHNAKEPSKAISIFLTFILIVVMATEMLGIYSKKPVFDNPMNPVFCDKTFYDYVFYMNFAIMAIGFLALLLHIPNKPRGDGRVIAQEHFDAI